MINIEIKVKCVRKPFDALCECLTVVKAINNEINLEFDCFKILVRPDSNISDLWEIHNLKQELQNTK